MKGKTALGFAALLVLFALVFRPENMSLRSARESAPTKPGQASASAKARLFPRDALQTFAPRSRFDSLAKIGTETDPDRQNELIEDALESISDSDVRASLDAVTDDTSPVAVEFRKRLVRRWAEIDAPSAAAWAAQIPAGPAHQDALEQISIGWGETDFAAAAAWVRTLPENEDKKIAALGLAYQAARNEPLIALDLARTLPPTRERDDFLVHGVSQWASTDPAEASAWAAEASDSVLRQRLLAAIAIAQSELDGAAGATMASISLDEETLNGSAVSIVQRWAQQSPEAAASWILQFPDGVVRNTAMQNLVALWTAESPEAAANWLNSLPEGTLRDVGTRAYLRASGQ